MKLNQLNMFFLESTNNRYAKLSGRISKDIDSFFKSKEDCKFFLKLNFYFAKESIEFYKYYNENEEIIEIYETYMLPELSTEKTDIILKYEGIKTRIHHVKNIFKRFLNLNPILFDDYVLMVNRKDDEEWTNEDKKFNLLYFKKYSECLESLTDFVKFFKKMFFVITDNFEIVNEKISLDTSPKLNENAARETEFLPIKTKFTKSTESLYIKSCNYLKNKIFENNNFFISTGKYDIDSYLDNLCKFVLELIESRRVDFYHGNQEKRKIIFRNLVVSIDNHLKRLQDNNEKEFCESEIFYNHFSYLLEKNVETFDDFMNVEKIMVDYTNMFTYIVNLIRIVDEPSSNKLEYLTPSPVFIDKFNHKIIDGIEIKFESLNKAKFNHIKAIDYDENVFILKEGVDFFINKFKKIYLPSDVLRMEKILKIEIFSSNNNIVKTFNINEYLIG